MALSKTSKAGTLAGAVALAVALLVPLEGRHKDGVYTDIAGVLTDCYGNTKNVKRGWIRSEEECKALLNGEAHRIGTFVLKDASKAPVGVLAAVISFTYNVGDHGYRTSTLRKHLLKGDWLAACKQLHRWVYITDSKTKIKVVAQGLKNRRDVEYKTCVNGLA